MDGMGTLISLLILFVVMVVLLIAGIKGKFAVYLTALTAALCAWLAGLILDANVADGFLSFRILLPVLTMGFCILKAVMRGKSE